MTSNLMGVFDFVKQGTEEMRIARPRSSHEPVHVFEATSFPLYAQLDVEPDECAVFVRDGRSVGIVGPGRHTLHPGKLPFLEGALDAAGRLPLVVVFLRLLPLEATRFSAVLDPITDPSALDAIAPRLDGELTVQIVDPAAFVEDHLQGGENRPLLARAGVIAALDRVVLATEGRRVPVFAGARLPRHRASVAPRLAANEGNVACRACGTEGEAGTFCKDCGTLLGQRCVGCRAELREGAKFCAACGVRV